VYHYVVAQFLNSLTGLSIGFCLTGPILLCFRFIFAYAYFVFITARSELQQALFFGAVSLWFFVCL